MSMNLTQIINSELNTEGQRKNILLGQSTVDFTVPANTTKTVISTTELRDYPYHYIVIKSSKKTYIVKEQYKTGSLSIPHPALPVMDGASINDVRAVSDWITCKGETVHIDVQNTGEEDITVTVFLMGVR